MQILQAAFNRLDVVVLPHGKFLSVNRSILAHGCPLISAKIPPQSSSSVGLVRHLSPTRYPPYSDHQLNQRLPDAAGGSERQ